MGSIAQPDHTLSLLIVLELINIVEQDWMNATPSNLALESTFYTLAYSLAWRGEEVP